MALLETLWKHSSGSAQSVKEPLHPRPLLLTVTDTLLLTQPDLREAYFRNTVAGAVDCP